MVNHCFEVRHRENIALERTISVFLFFVFFRQNMTTEQRNTCSHSVKAKGKREDVTEVKLRNKPCYMYLRQITRLGKEPSNRYSPTDC